MDPLSAILNYAHEAVTSDVPGKLFAAIFGAMVGAGLNWYSKRNRLKAAIKIEIQLTYDNFKAIFSPAEHKWFIDALIADPNYRIVIISSPRHVIINNLTDDISYVRKSIAEKFIKFVDTSGFIDDSIRFMRSEEFHNLPIERKLKVLAVPFNEQPEFQTLAEEILKDL